MVASQLPQDSKRRISYIYSLYAKDSFTMVASHHVKYLKYKYDIEQDHIELEEIDWSQLGSLNWNEKRNVLIHPFLYPFASLDSFSRNSKNFAKLLMMKNKLAGLDVADSSKISNFAVNLINKIDLMLVPSGFSRDAYISSGVLTPVEILPHGISDEFLKETPNTVNSEILNLRKSKEFGNILILYFLAHSEHRKGADIVRNVMKRIQKKFPNVYLVIKGPNHNYFSGINTIYISSWLNNNDLVALYDVCDICLSPSRGGGFELNALEAISRGIPTLVTNGGCFLDLINYFIPIDLSNKADHDLSNKADQPTATQPTVIQPTQPLPGNSIHIGYGYEADINDLETKLIDTINRLEYWKKHFKGNIKEIREKYSWESIVKMLDEHLQNYGFK